MVSWSRYESMTERQRSQADTEMIMAQGRREVKMKLQLRGNTSGKRKYFSQGIQRDDEGG